MEKAAAEGRGGLTPGIELGAKFYIMIFREQWRELLQRDKEDLLQEWS